MVRGERRKRWESVSLSFPGQERAVYEVVLSSDRIVLRATSSPPFPSMSTVSRMLEPLENRGLVERRRRGMGAVLMPQ